MSISALKQQNTTLKVVTDKIKSHLAETQLQAVGRNTIVDKTIKPASEVLITAEDKFTITFSYQQQLHRTKVNVAGTAYGMPIYKVALNSRLSEGSKVCWLQNTVEGWVTLLGEQMDTKLVKAIISAIESQQ